MTGTLEVHGGCDADHCAGRATNGVVFFGSKEKGWPRKLARCDSRLDRLPIQQVFYMEVILWRCVVFVNRKDSSRVRRVAEDAEGRGREESRR